MKHWYAKELSDISQVSVRTLHHYDRIDLLKPSLRQSNGYRLYSETDLAKLQQIIALKFFGFNLSQIQKLLAQPINVLQHFAMQEKFLQEKAETLMEASSMLKRITSECDNNQAISWEKIIEIMKVYRMTQQLENAWLGDVLSTEELKQYAEFEKNLKTRFSEQDKAAFEKNWFNIITDISQNINQDPRSDLGIAIGKKCLDLINGFYGKENANLKKSIWDNGFKKGKNNDDHSLTPEMVNWLDAAMDAYWRKRIYTFLAQVDDEFSNKWLADWNSIMEEIYGDQLEPRKELLTIAFADKNISNTAKDWLRNMFPG